METLPPFGRVSTDYDNMDRVVSKKVNGTEIAHYTYNSSGNLGILEDKTNNVTYKYIYDLAERLIKVTDSNGNSFKSGYDLNNNVNQLAEVINGKTLTTGFQFDKDNRVKEMTLNDASKSIGYKYDSLARLTSKVLNLGNSAAYTTSYKFITDATGVKQADGTTKYGTTSKVESIKNNESVISYTYDKNGNIETITQGKSITKYYYNELNELVREDNADLNKTITYSYDAGGNITSKTEYAYTTNPANPGTSIASKSYAYGDSNWKDKLTSYNGKAITYDAIGNPLTYDGYTYTWQAGRQLSGISGNGKNINYKYNDSGIRTEKNVNGAVTKYILNGSDVVYEETGNDEIYYTYDNLGKLVSMNLNGVEYYYVRNAQGDVIGLIDGNGNQVAAYTYDSWGKLVSIKDGNGNNITNDRTSVGYQNPYRYRGYRYDAETGLYYLQSRYYSPEWGRFINADGLIGQTGELLSHNMFSYCKNNPVNMTDKDGFKPFINNQDDAMAYTRQLEEEAREKTLTQDQNVFVATIVSEASYTSKGTQVSTNARKAVANVIINRIGKNEWAKYTTASQICANTRFDAYGGKDYQECMAYLLARNGSNRFYEQVISEVMSIYYGEVGDITGGCQLYYTPATMTPKDATPPFVNYKVQEVSIPAVDPEYEFRFYKYR